MDPRRVADRIDVRADDVADDIILAQRFHRSARGVNQDNRMVGVHFLDDLICPRQRRERSPGPFGFVIALPGPQAGMVLEAVENLAELGFTRLRDEARILTEVRHAMKAIARGGIQILLLAVVARIKGGASWASD